MCEREIAIQFLCEQILFLLEHLISEIGRAHQLVENACKVLSIEPGRLTHSYHVPCLLIILAVTFPASVSHGSVECRPSPPACALSPCLTNRSCTWGR